MQYKCVPAPMGLVITGEKDYESAVRSYADIINKEAINDWKYHSMEHITVEHQPGCLAALFGAKETTKSYNMLVFSNESLEYNNEVALSQIENNKNFDGTYIIKCSILGLDLVNEPTDYYSGIAMSIKNGTSVVKIDEKTVKNISWSKIQDKNGKGGWCLTKYIIKL